MKLLILPLLIYFYTTPTWSSTFIGNGGNSGDVELLVSTQQLQQTLSYITKSSEESELCECHYVFEGKNLCKLLKKLSTKQRNLCAKTLKTSAPKLLRVFSDKQKYSTLWTHKNIEVFENNNKRAADAVTNSKTRTITLNHKNFMNLLVGQRLFLLTHEGFHLVKNNKGKFFTDEGAYKTFTGPTGSKDLLNAMSAALVMQAAEADLFNKHWKNLDRSQAWKKRWLDLSFGSYNLEDQASSTYFVNSYNITDLSFRYYFDNLGLVLNSHSSSGSSQILAQTTSSENLRAYGAGVSYRVFINQNPLSFFGQSHLVFNLLYEMFTSQAEVKDNITGLTSRADGFGVNFNCNYYMPFNNNLWLVVKAFGRQLNYKHSLFNTNYDTLRYGATIGASYGF